MLIERWQRTRGVTGVALCANRTTILVWNRPWLRERINASQATRLEQQLQHRAIWVELTTAPPNCGSIGFAMLPKAINHDFSRLSAF